MVVCQHGLEGRPQDVADPKKDQPAYHRYACKLAERGFVAYAPQNPYIFGDRFRTLQRKANPLGKTLFSVIVPQHQQTTNWLASLPFVDPERIAFYGLSYGGKTAMRVPALVDRYCLSICSADFNEWIWKNTSLRSAFSYVGTGEYEIFEWDLGNTFNYAEMAGLIAPRPFMVERGHRDGVGPDEWVAYEYAKVRQLYAELKIPERTDDRVLRRPAHDPRGGDVRVPARAVEVARAMTSVRGMNGEQARRLHGGMPARALQCFRGSVAAMISLTPVWLKPLKPWLRSRFSRCEPIAPSRGTCPPAPA